MINKEVLLERKRKAMENFHPTEEVVSKIVEFNDGLFGRFKLLYEDVMEIRNTVEELREKGKPSFSGYEIFPEFFFCYDYEEEGIPTVNGDVLMDLSDATPSWAFPTIQVSDLNSRPYESFDEWALCAMSLGDERLNWNIEDLDLPGLEKHHLYYFMHSLFVDSGTFCVADIPYLKPEDLQWQVVVQFEKFFHGSQRTCHND